MHELIITRILNRGVVTLSELEDRASQRGLSLSDLYAALDRVSRDKRITRSVNRGEVVFKPAPVPKAPTEHLKWVRDNYVRMTPETSADHPAFADLDYSFLFLKPDELLEYKAEAKGMPVHVLQSKQYGKNTRG